MPVTLYFFQLLDDRAPIGVIDWEVTIEGDVDRIVMPPNYGADFAQKILEERGFNVALIADQEAAAEAFSQARYHKLKRSGLII